jgi:hypothetical protein
MVDMHHLKEALEEHNTVAVDWSGSLFCGVKTTWDYINRHVDSHMPGYITKALNKYHHPQPMTPQHAPYKALPIQYGTKIQRVKEDDSPQLLAKEIKCVQDIVGTLLYYRRAVNSTLLASLSPIAAHQSHGIKALQEACHQPLDYVATPKCRHPLPCQ